jgi:hypothetical protein
MRGDIYASSTTLFTLETGSPQNTWSKFITSSEGAIGFTLLGLVIAYLPVFYGAFSERERHMSLLDARAGSPPSALGLLNLNVSDPDRIESFLERFEHWAAELLANELSFPMIAFFRSHHPNQSWLTALTALTDAAAVISLCSEGDLKRQAELTFAMGRHAFADIAFVFRVDTERPQERLSDGDLTEIRRVLAQHPADIFDSSRFKGEDLRDLTKMYEPQAQALSAYLLMTLPSWSASAPRSKDWVEEPSHLAGNSEAVSDPFRKD